MNAWLVFYFVWHVPFNIEVMKSVKVVPNNSDQCTTGEKFLKKYFVGLI